MPVNLLQLGQSRAGLDRVEVVQEVNVDVVTVRATAAASSVSGLGGSGSSRSLTVISTQYMRRRPQSIRRLRRHSVPHETQDVLVYYIKYAKTHCEQRLLMLRPSRILSKALVFAACYASVYFQPERNIVGNAQNAHSLICDSVGLDYLYVYLCLLEICRANRFIHGSSCAETAILPFQ